MPEYLRALIVVLGLTFPVFWIARRPVCELAWSEADFVLRRNMWIGITVVAFLGHNFWVYAVVCAVALLIVGAKVTNRFGLYLFLLFAVPPFSAEIAGFGGINYLMELNHPRILSLTLLLPVYLTLRRDEQTVPFGREWADRFLVAYLLLQLVLQGSVDTVTNTLRSALYFFIDVFLPYYAASRSLRDLRACRDICMSFVFAALLMAPVAAFEYLRHWLLFSSMPGALGVPFGFGNYLSRGDSLRALASTGHSIILGYVMVVALSLYVFANRSIHGRKIMLLALLTLVAGLLTPVARGPWVGAAAALALLLITGPNKAKRTSRFLAIAIPVGGVIMLTPMGAKIIDLLPFVGTVDDFNVTYRQRLFDVSMQVLMSHPWLGSFDYLSAPVMQQMIQGEGIIDMVNSYLTIALSYGVIGLSMFVGVFVCAAWSVLRVIRQADVDAEAHYLARALLAALVGTLITIATVSSILIIPTVYWLVAGLCVGCTSFYARAAKGTVVALATSTTATQAMASPGFRGAWSRMK
ncbi:MAG: O-antigen ligase family protein [Rhizobacter sp.]|nr:O-antigen ligase family protein [Rhizobacter sp.]